MTLDWVQIVGREGAALVDAAELDLGAAVPAAPGWDVTDLLRHIGLIDAWTSVILRTGTLERPSRSNGMLPEPPSEHVLEWYRETLAGLVDDLGAVDDPERPVYSFAPAHQRAGFWPRRMAQETVVHRVDAEQAVGRPVGVIDPALAADGIDEIFTIFVPSLGASRSPGDGRSVRLEPTEVEVASWIVRFGDGAVTLEPDLTTVDASVRGPAAALLLWLWGRQPLEALDVSGTRDAAEALRAVTTF